MDEVGAPFALRALQLRWVRSLVEDEPARMAQDVAGTLGPHGPGLYASGVAGRWLDVLAETFPVTQTLVGPVFFRWMARRYLRSHPPTSPDLRALGQQLPRFVADFAPADTVPYLDDVARLEWAIHLAAGSARPPPLDPAVLTSAEAAITPLILAAGASILDPDLPADRIWAAHQVSGPDAGRGPHSGSALAQALGEPAAPLAVWRSPSGALRVERLDPDARTGLARLAQPVSVMDLVGSGCDPERLGAWLGPALAEGVVRFVDPVPRLD